MNEQIQALLDGTISEKDREALNELLRADAEARAEFAQQMKLHALLSWRAGAATVEAPVGAHLAPPDSTPGAGIPRHKVFPQRWTWIGAAAAVAVIAGLLALFLPQPTDAAVAALNRMIAVTARAGGRTYRLQVLVGESEFHLSNGQRASCEGALLHLGRGGQFVYECGLSNGSRRISGSDGRTSWDILGSAPVHLSQDPTRFRHHLPGERQGFTYLDPGAQLALIRDGYDITLTPGGAGMESLRAVKRSREFRGPREAVVTFEEKSGTIRSIDLFGLPQARGGPSALRLILTGEPEFPDGFFQHGHHHEKGRRVENDDIPKQRPG